MNTFEPRTYRQQVSGQGLVSVRVAVEETDLHVQVSAECLEWFGQTDDTQEQLDGLREYAEMLARHARQFVRIEIIWRSEFLTSLTPIVARDHAGETAVAMYEAARRADVGPMAAVAGAIAGYVGRGLSEHASDVIVENGGDIYLSTTEPRTVAVYAGRSPLSDKVGICIPAGETVGICTSSATVGPSFSAGKTDAALIIANDAAFADAMASALGNRIRAAEDIEAAVGWASGVPGVRQALAIIGPAMGVAGEFEITRL